MVVLPEPPQDERDLLRLIATLRTLAAGDAAKAPVCRVLLDKLVPFTARDTLRPPQRAA
jgi:hypothetical protein